MANYEWTYHLKLIDVNGNTATMTAPGGQISDATTVAQLATDVAALVTAIGAPATMTNAAITQSSFSVLLTRPANPVPVDAEYSRVEDGARMNFLNSAGGRGILTLPAPVAAVFGVTPNEDVVNGGGAAAPLIAWFQGHAIGNGALLAVYNGGVKTGRHARRRAQHRVA